MTILEATREWVSEFNVIPYRILAKLIEKDPDEVREITPVVEGDQVLLAGGSEGTVTAIADGIAEIRLDDGRTVRAKTDRLDVCRDDILPLWGTLWSFRNKLDEAWLEKHLPDMARCGFRIFEQEDYGYVFGIDGAGYDFFIEHWIPLYHARGLRWHRT